MVMTNKSNTIHVQLYNRSELTEFRRKFNDQYLFVSRYYVLPIDLDSFEEIIKRDFTTYKHYKVQDNDTI